MTGLAEWAARHGVTPAALAELRQIVRPPEIQSEWLAQDEASRQNMIRLEASRIGAVLWRNNVGAGKLENGSFVRWGLCNDSAKLNDSVKSADLVGIYPLLITADMVGQTVGQFWSVEVKRAGWKYSGTKREEAQLKWATAVQAYGGRSEMG